MNVGLRCLKQRVGIFCITVLFLFFCTAADAKVKSIDYSRGENWAYEDIGANKPVDLFIVAPTVDFGTKEKLNMDMADTKMRGNFLGALNMERGIYEDNCRMYAPYYRQVTLSYYEMGLEGKNEKDRANAYRLAKNDVEAAFDYYLKNYNQGRGIVLAGFSQGSQLVIELMKVVAADKNLQKRVVAAYCPGWVLTKHDVERYKLKPALGAKDLGCIVSFNSEAVNIKDSMMVPADSKGKIYAINPLNWRTDSVPASPLLNKGACFTDYQGNIKKEIPYLTGAYLDRERKTLKVTGVTPKEYPPVLPLFGTGVYHLYDYQFFYRNLQANVADRVAAYSQANIAPIHVVK